MVSIPMSGYIKPEKRMNMDITIDEYVSLPLDNQ